MQKCIRHIMLVTFFLHVFLLLSIQAFTQTLQVPSIFGNEMVLQREMEPSIWGKAAPGAVITISLDNRKRQYKADNSGYWVGRLPEPKAGAVYTLTVQAGGEKIVFTNVIGGDVYYAGGQSNMQYSVSAMTGGEEEIASAGYPGIRLFTVPRDIAYRPRFDINKGAKESEGEGRWITATPASVKDFSAVAYSFAKKIHKEENIPIGIINVSWGGTPIEAHMSTEANRSLPYNAKALFDIAAKGAGDSLVIDKKRATPQLPGTLFNAMIHPLIPFGLKGFLWYQGEHNWNHPFRHREQLAAFINDLRIRWQQGYLPFYLVQLPNTGKVPVSPSEDFWSVLRESQSMALRLPNTAMIVSLDIGDGDLHPKNKKAFGERLALLAQKNIYGKSLPAEGPLFQSYAVVRDTIELTFSNAGSGLLLRNDTARVFSIAGNDRRFHWAKVVLKDNKLLVFSSEVKNPVSVRYAWGENPSVTLFNREGLPAAPFRTDTWPVREDGRW